MCTAPKLFHNGDLTELPGFEDLVDYCGYVEPDNVMKTAQIVGQTPNMGLIVAYGQNDHSFGDGGHFRVELRDPDGTIVWTSAEVDLTWSYGPGVPLIRRGEVDSKGDIVVAGLAKSGSFSTYLAKFSRSTTDLLWRFPASLYDNYDFGVFVRVTSHGNSFKSAVGDSGLMKLDTNGNEMGASTPDF